MGSKGTWQLAPEVWAYRSRIVHRPSVCIAIEQGNHVRIQVQQACAVQVLYVLEVLGARHPLGGNREAPSVARV